MGPFVSVDCSSVCSVDFGLEHSFQEALAMPEQNTEQIRHKYEALTQLSTDLVELAKRCGI